MKDKCTIIPPRYLPIHLSICLSVNLSAYLNLSICKVVFRYDRLSINQSVPKPLPWHFYLSICLSVCLSIHSTMNTYAWSFHGVSRIILLVDDLATGDHLHQPPSPATKILLYLPQLQERSIYLSHLLQSFPPLKERFPFIFLFWNKDFTLPPSHTTNTSVYLPPLKT